MRMTVETVGIRLFVCLSVSVCQVGSWDNAAGRSAQWERSLLPRCFTGNLGMIPSAVDHFYLLEIKKKKEKKKAFLETSIEMRQF